MSSILQSWIATSVLCLAIALTTPMVASATTAVELIGGTQNGRCGSSVAVGDVNGDGLPDAVMGCYMQTAGQFSSGSAFVFTRTAGSVGFSSGTELVDPTPSPSGYCGTSIAAGDLNGDGRADIVMGCDGASSSAGNVVVFMRNATNTGFAPGVELNGPSPNGGDSCGSSVSVGDVNGDGRADVATGCDGDDTSGANAGNAVVFTRNAANTGFDAGVALEDPTPTSAWCGTSVAVGDVNGDGRADVAMGCTRDGTGAGNSGNVVVFLRSVSNAGFEAGVELADPTPSSASCGTSLAIGDVNDDGRAELVTGCELDSSAGGFAGNLISFARNASNTGFDQGIELADSSPTAGDHCGRSVAVGEGTGDRRADIVTGCELHGSEGVAVMFSRNANNDGTDPSVDLMDPHAAPGDKCGSSVAVSSTDGDQHGLIAVGCSYDSTGSFANGNMVVFVPTPDLTGPPAIVGTPTVNSALTCNPGTWSGSPTFVYQWSRDGTAIDGTSAHTYVVQEADLETMLTCHVTATNSSGATGATSDGLYIPGPPTLPGTPTGCIAVAQSRGSDSRVTFSWTAPGGLPAAQNYEISYSHKGLGDWTVLPLTAVTAGTIDGLVPGSSYSYRVRSEAGGQYSATYCAIDVTVPLWSILSGGGSGNTITGFDGMDLIRGGGGNDKLSGRGGNDKLYGGQGRDTLQGGPGADSLYGGAGADTLIGGPGKDLLAGGDAGDTINANDLRSGDTVNCGAGRDTAIVDRGDSTRNCERVIRR